MQLSFLDKFAEIKTHKQAFLQTMDGLLPWDEWQKIIKPHYHRSGGVGRQPFPLDTMLRIFVLQNLYDLADMNVTDQVADSRAFAQFCKIQDPTQVPDGDTVGNFRNLLTKAGLQTMLFKNVLEILQRRGLVLKKGTIVDSTIINAPSSTKNKENSRDPDAHQVKKGNEWRFGYKGNTAQKRCVNFEQFSSRAHKDYNDLVFGLDLPRHGSATQDVVELGLLRLCILIRLASTWLGDVAGSPQHLVPPLTKNLLETHAPLLCGVSLEFSRHGSRKRGRKARARFARCFPRLMSAWIPPIKWCILS